MTEQRQFGFGTIGIILIILCLTVAGLVGWRVWDASQTKNMTPVSTTNDSTKSTGTLQTDPNEGYVVIKEWGVRFKPVAGLENIVYFKPRIVTSDAFSFTTTEMGQKEPRCNTSSDMIPFGLLQRGKNTDPAAGGEVATIDGYVYQYRGPDAACSEDSANLTQESKIVNQIMQSIRSLEPAK